MYDVLNVFYDPGGRYLVSGRHSVRNGDWPSAVDRGDVHGPSEEDPLGATHLPTEAAAVQVSQEVPGEDVGQKPSDESYYEGN